MEKEEKKKKYTWRPKYPHTYDDTFEEFLESEEFERLEADVMSMVYKAFQKGYLFGMSVSAPRLLELKTEVESALEGVDQVPPNQTAEDPLMGVVDELMDEGVLTGREGFEILMQCGGADN